MALNNLYTYVTGSRTFPNVFIHEIINLNNINNEIINLRRKIFNCEQIFFTI